MNSPVMPIVLLACLGVAAVMLIKIFGRIPATRAKLLLKQGAKLLDVRSPEEFASGNLNGAMNVPYREVADRIAAITPDKSVPVLVYCRSGGRSGIAASTLKRLGYRRAFNLGSLERARRIIESS